MSRLAQTLPARNLNLLPNLGELCREHGISSATFYKWRAKYGGMDASMMSQMKSLEDENRRLKRMFADLSMQADLLREALGKK
jgi:putative transposase